MEKTMKKLLGIAMLAMVSIGASAQDETNEPNVQVNIGFNDFVGGTVTAKPQVVSDESDNVVVTITVTPDDGYFITKNDVVVVPTRAAVRKKDGGPMIAEPLELTGEDPADLTAPRDYSFTMSKELGAWVYEANFQQIATSGTFGEEKESVEWIVTSETVTVGEGDEAHEVEVKTLTFTGDVALPALGDASAPWEMLKKKITNVVIGEGISAISDNLFSGFTSLVSIEIQNGKDVIGLGEGAIPANEGLIVDVPGNLYNAYKVDKSWQGINIDSKNAIKMTGVEFGASNDYDAFVCSQAVMVPSVMNALLVTDIDKDNTLVIQEITDGVIPADTPVLLLSKELNGDDFRTAPAPAKDPETKGGTTENLLKVAPKGGQEVKLGEVYLLYNDVFYLSQAGTIAEGGIYLAIPAKKDDTMTKARRNYAIAIGDTGTTDIITVNDDDGAAAPVWYGLDGRRLEGIPTQKGLYIANGMKVAVK